MISRIARKELTEILRDGRFRILSVAVVAVSLVSLAVGWKQYADVSRQHEEAQASTRQQWLKQSKRNPHSAAHYGVYAFKPKSPLAIVDTGIDPYVGVAVWLEAHKQNEFKYRPAQDRTAVERFGEMTAAGTLQVLVPLFIVLMTFSAFSAEREQGTLRQLLSLGVRPRDLALGKATGIAAALGLVLVPAAAFGVAALALAAGGGFLSSSPARSGLLVLFYLLYFAVITALSLGVSARAKSSRLALVVLLSFWFANSIVASRVVADAASWLHPTPSAVEFQKAMEADLNNPKEMQARLERRKAELMAKYNASSMDAVPIAFSGVSLQEGEIHGDEVFDRHYGRLFDTYDRQNKSYQLGGLAAPMLAMRSISMGLAGTDFPQHRHFVAATEDYRRVIQRTMNEDIMAHPTRGGPYLAGPELWAKVPEFDYTAPPASWVVGNVSSSIVILAAWLAIAAAWMARPFTAPGDLIDMLAHILRHEWRILRADATVWVVGGVFAAAIAYGMVNGIRWIEFQRTALQLAGSEEQERYARMSAQIRDLEQAGKPVAGFGDPRNPTTFGSRFGPRYVSLPPGPLAPLAIGQSDLLPSYFKVSTDARETIVAAAEIENPHRLLSGRFDLAFALVFLYPLLILAVAHNLLSAEKEEGTLALALSQSVSLGTLVRGKVAMRALLLVGVVVGFSLLALVVGRVDLGAPGVAAGLGLWVAAVLAYGAFWFALAVLVASFGRSSATNATVLATVWLALVVLLPSLFNLVATTLYPVPSRVEMIQAMRLASDEATAAGGTLLAKYYEDHPELASGGAEQAMNDFSVIRVAVDDDVARRVRPVISRYEQRIAQQQAIIDRVRFLSPAILMQEALNDVAGTGTARHQHFLAQVDRFHARWRGFIVPLIFQKARIKAFDAVPAFSYEEESTTGVVRRVLVGGVGMLVPAIGLAAVGLRRLRRYPIVG